MQLTRFTVPLSEAQAQHGQGNISNGSQGTGNAKVSNEFIFLFVSCASVEDASDSVEDVSGLRGVDVVEKGTEDLELEFLKRVEERAATELRLRQECDEVAITIPRELVLSFDVMSEAEGDTQILSVASGDEERSTCA